MCVCVYIWKYMSLTRSYQYDINCDASRANFHPIRRSLRPGRDHPPKWARLTVKAFRSMVSRVTAMAFCLCTWQ